MPQGGRGARGAGGEATNECDVWPKWPKDVIICTFQSEIVQRSTQRERELST
jgi:hypothetical protein